MIGLGAATRLALATTEPDATARSPSASRGDAPSSAPPQTPSRAYAFTRRCADETPCLPATSHQARASGILGW